MGAGALLSTASLLLPCGRVGLWGMDRVGQCTDTSISVVDSIVVAVSVSVMSLSCHCGTGVGAVVVVMVHGAMVCSRRVEWSWAGHSVDGVVVAQVRLQDKHARKSG